MSDIQKFYEDSTILITGGTGFLGKLLVEKLLRTCQNLKHIYLIMRNKSGCSAKERMEVYFEDQVFSRLKSENPQYSNKVTAIQGDIECSDLNLSKDDTELLINTVNVVFHAAAAISFNQKLRAAAETNLHGIRKILDLSQNMKNLKALIHVSTVYANCHLDRIEEKIYKNDVSYLQMINLLRTCNDDELQKITPRLLGKSPNTYTFTKALAEEFIKDNYSGLPVGIFRPAIVVSTEKEPIQGWIDNFYGPTGLIASAACGFLHVVHGGNDVFSNVVPADMVVNALIASGWEVGQKCKKLPVYNFVSTQNPLTWGEYIELTKLGLDYPFSNSIWYMSLILIQNRWLYEIYKFFLQKVPAFIIDMILQLFMNKPPHFRKKYKKIHTLVKFLSYFTTKNWEYENENIRKLWSKMSERDRRLFNFDITTIDWQEYFKHYIKGIRVYLFKEDLSNIETARLKYRRLYWAHQFCKYSSLMLMFYYFFRMIR